MEIMFEGGREVDGGGGGGRTTENVVKHVSLNWSPEEQPSRDHMIETAEGFLRHMGWDEHP
jgi:hypothetical protein